MRIVAVAWMFVVLLFALAEATAADGTLLGAFFTLLLYGLLPLAIVLYVLGTPARRRALRAQEAALAAAAASAQPRHGRGEAAGDAVAAEGKES